jgi:hypothetical protein
VNSAAPRSACHAEGRRFESLQPLPNKAPQLAAFSRSDPREASVCGGAAKTSTSCGSTSTLSTDETVALAEQLCTPDFEFNSETALVGTGTYRGREECGRSPAMSERRGERYR